MSRRDPQGAGAALAGIGTAVVVAVLVPAVGAAVGVYRAGCWVAGRVRGAR